MSELDGAGVFLDPQGHDSQEEMLVSLIEQKKLPQTLLFHGPQGIGKAAVARRLACYLLAGSNGSGGSLFGPSQRMEFDTDSPAVKRALNGSHADLLWIEPELSGQNQQPIIKIDAARDVATFFSKTAAESSRRIAVIDGAEALNGNAANALLKIVEEPPLNGLLILIAHQPGRVLPTLLSRCRKVGFEPLDESIFINIIQILISNISSDKLSLLYMLSSGSPGLAIKQEKYELIDSYHQFLSLLQAYPEFAHQDVQSLQRQVDKIAKVGGYGLWGQLWLTLIARLNLVAAGALESGATADELALLTRVASHRPAYFWQELYRTSVALLDKAHGLHLERKQVIQSLILMLFNKLELAA